MSTLLRLGLAGVQGSTPPPKARLRHAALFVASLALVLVLSVPPLLGSFLDDGRALGISPDELKVFGTLLVIVGVFSVGYIVQSSGREEPPEEQTDVDAFVESLRAFEDNDALRREQRQTLYYDEFRFRD